MPRRGIRDASISHDDSTIGSTTGRDAFAPDARTGSEGDTRVCEIEPDAALDATVDSTRSTDPGRRDADCCGRTEAASQPVGPSESDGARALNESRADVDETTSHSTGDKARERRLSGPCVFGRIGGPRSLVESSRAARPRADTDNRTGCNRARRGREPSRVGPYARSSRRDDRHGGTEARHRRKRPCARLESLRRRWPRNTFDTVPSRDDSDPDDRSRADSGARQRVRAGVSTIASSGSRTSQALSSPSRKSIWVRSQARRRVARRRVRSYGARLAFRRLDTTP
jgi:hypothetical protein